MKISCVINHVPRTFDVDPMMSLRELLVSAGHVCVRDSDDSEGFCGSDTVLVDGTPVYSNLYLAGEADGCDILTPDGLGDAGHLSDVQQAMIDAGVVQSAYNAPAAALLLTWLLENNPDPTKEEIEDALSGIFIRDASYEHYFLAVQLVRERRKLGHYETKTAPIFREQLREIGTPDGKVDGPALVSGQRAYVEDYVSPDACVLVVLRSPYASAYIKSIDTAEAEKVPGVVKIITAANCPDIYYMQAGMTGGCLTGRSAMSETGSRGLSRRQRKPPSRRRI